ncbi:MAG TPA: DNA-3-methyladenine glycosylase [Planctomycetaceae bacterium]|nr:DNA-3-methyladenine glycosylase [Planctomycetaceae bacterium]
MAASGSELKLAPLERQFYERDPITVGKNLLGALLVRDVGSEILLGRIVETEAYLAAGDTANHAHRGRTQRNRSMFGPAGHAYVYAIHNCCCLNVVTERAGVPSAVLIRAVEPVGGIEHMRARRGGVPDLQIARGPGRLCQAFDIDRRLDGWDLTDGCRLWISAGTRPAESRIVHARRVGVTSAGNLELRFYVAGSPWVSRAAR